MTIRPQSDLKAFFETGDRPTQAQFSDLIDSSAPDHFTTVAALLADTTASYPTGMALTAAGYRYTVAASGATDHHIVTAPGGVKLKSGVLDGAMPIMAFGAVGDGATSDAAAYALAVAAADATDSPVLIPADRVIYLPAGTHVLPSRGFCGGGEIRGAAYTYAHTGAPTTILTSSGSYGSPISIASPAQGDRTIAAANSYAAGDVLQIRDDTGTVANNRIEIAIVKSATGSVITLNSGLKYSYGPNASVRKITARGRFSDGGCRFRNVNLTPERYNGIDICGSYYASRIYLTECVNAKILPSCFDGMGANVWCGIANCTRLFTVQGHFQNIDSTDTQGYVKLNCGVHDGLVDVVVVGGPGAVDTQNGVHIDTYWLNNTRIAADYLACSNIRARCNATGIDRSIFVACNPTLTSGAQPQSWNIDVEGAGVPLTIQRITGSRIVAQTLGTSISLYGTTDCDVYCRAKPGIFTIGGLSVSNLRVSYSYAATVNVRGQSSAGAGAYTIAKALVKYIGGWAELDVTCVWTGHTGAGNLLCDVICDTPINNANNAICVLGRTTAATDILRLEFSATANAGTDTPTNTFVLRETAAAGGGLGDIAAAGTLQFTAKWPVALFGQ